MNGVPGETAALRRFLDFLDRLRALLAIAATATALLHFLAVASVALVLNALIVERLPGSPWGAFALAVSGTAGLAVAAVRVVLAAGAALAPGGGPQGPGASSPICATTSRAASTWRRC